MSRSTSRLVAAFLGLGALFLWPTQGGRAALKKIDFDELVDTAGRIVHGRVVETRSFLAGWTAPEDLLIVTEIELEPISVLKGEVTGERVVFRVPGGRIGDLEAVVSEAPVVVPGGEIVVFLSRHQLGFEYVWAHWQGKYDVVRGPRPGGAARVKGLPGAPITRDVRLEELADSVLEAMGRAERARSGREEVK